MNYLVYIFVALMPFIITNSLWDYSNLPKILFIRNGVILLAVVFFWTRKLKDITISRTLIAYMVFVAWAGLSIFWATNKYEALIVCSHWAICGLFLFLVQNMNMNKTVIFLILVGTAWIVALFGLTQQFFHIDWVLQSGPPASTFANNNLAGTYILLTMPLCVAFMISTYQNHRWVPFGLFCMILVTMLTYMHFATFRSGMVAIAMIGIYCLGRYFPKPKCALIAALIIAFFMAGYIYWAPKFFDPSGRLQMWRNTAEIIKQHPVIGVGVGNFKVSYDKYAELQRNTNDAHNDYIQVFCELGGVGFYLALLVAIYAYFGAVKKRDLYSTALKMGLAAILMIAMVHFPMQKAVDPAVCALYLGILRV